MAYIDIPREITYQEIVENNYNLSSNAHKKLLMKNANFKTLGELLDRELMRSDLGVEVGSFAYVKKSPFYFMRSKALQAHSFLPETTSESVLCILPQSFVNVDLKKGDVIISKDSNIGEVVILEKDYPNTMLSGAMYKLPISQHKYYALAFIKHKVFREQLDFIVPKGATIRHAKQLFLNCKIPFPNYNSVQTIAFIETLTQSIIAKERLIKERHAKIFEMIESELTYNQKSDSFTYSYPTFAELQKSSRLDTGIYCEEFKKIDFLIKNYKNGVFYIDENHIKSGSTPKTRFIGKEEYLKHQWLTPSHCSDYGIIKEVERINFIGNANLIRDCILFINRGQGRDCGKSIFYNLNDLGFGHHNQGMYRIFNYPKYLMLFMLCFLNTGFMRTYCTYLSLGSKMKELKIEHFLQIPFPNFPIELQEQITKLYHNPNAKVEYKNLNLENFKTQDNEFCEIAGIYELDKSIKTLKSILNSAIDDIVNDREVKIKF
ncbi:restriction endonuclease subunit S [Helicobacter sp. MIT 14-3879]|uniref:restriction endonuclease subunit S n=1 Tax=Helicobacter sp. MIT 14-3879 TaxID=2040649 RepID=UPI000E1F73FD|nr:restriction endonuclease subunit S [Helicobacter sp. MIT 14-3879]RDU61310.1 hypothetical protein CQA44_09395 [Helicobacter sp. MIT 14-3879]